MIKVICFGLLSVIISLSSVPVFAEYNISLGIHMMEQYNDNIFLDSSNEEADFISTVSPNIVFNYSSGKVLDLTLYYGLNFRFYDRHSHLNDEDINDVQDITAEARIKPSNIIFIDIADRYDRVPSDVRRNSALDNYHQNMTSMNKFTASPYCILPLTDTISATIGYSYKNTWYKDPSSVNSDAHSAFLILDKKFSPRITGAVQYEYFAYRRELNGEGSGVAVVEYDTHGASAGFDYKITPSVKINGELGEAWFDYQTVDVIREFYWNIGIDNIFKITEKTLIGVDSGIHFRDSTTSGASRSQELNLHFETGNILKFELDPYYHDIKYLTSDRKDRRVGVAFALSRPLTKKIEVSVGGKWEENKYVDLGEDARKYSVGSNLNYSLNRRMNISMDYRFNRQNASSDISNEELEINDYKNNIAWLQASLTF